MELPASPSVDPEAQTDADCLFNVQAITTGTRNKLPPDVAATILKCLKEKSVNPEKFKPHKPMVQWDYEVRKKPQDLGQYGG